MSPTVRTSGARIATTLTLDTKHPYGHACAHRGIGDALHLTDHPDAAAESWRQALDLFTSLGTPEAEEVRAGLALKNDADTLPSA
jgi:hypothetical protein